MAGGVNSYSYGNNSPISYIDPFGLTGGVADPYFINPNYIEAARNAAVIASSAIATAASTTLATTGIVVVGTFGYGYLVVDAIHDGISEDEAASMMAGGTVPIPSADSGSWSTPGDPNNDDPDDKCKAKPNKLSRYQGEKPSYHVNPQHVPGRGLKPGKTPLPRDAEAVYRNAVPNDPKNPTAWFGRNADGQIYRYSLGNDGTAHFSGIRGVGSGTRNLTTYAINRLRGL